MNRESLSNLVQASAGPFVNGSLRIFLMGGLFSRPAKQFYR